MGVKKSNYTQIPNELIDVYMAQMNGSELKVILYMARQIFGYHRPGSHVEIVGQKEIAEAVGLSLRAVGDALKALEKLDLVRTISRGNGKANGYAIVVEDDKTYAKSAEVKKADLRKKCVGTYAKSAEVTRVTSAESAYLSAHKERKESVKESADKTPAQENTHTLEIQESLEPMYVEREAVIDALSKALKVSPATEKNRELLNGNAKTWLSVGYSLQSIEECMKVHAERWDWKKQRGQTVSPPTFDQLLGYAMEYHEQGHDAAPGYDPACEHGCNKGYIDVFEGADVTRAKCSCRIQLEAKEKVQ